MVSAGVSRTIVGIIGNVISMGLFLSPVKTFYRIVKKKSVEEFQPYTYVVTVMNCLFWILYGLPVVHPDSTLVWTINGAGLVLELVYIGIFLYYAPGKARKKVLLLLLLEVIAVGAVAACVLTLLHTHEERSRVVGIICAVFNVAMYASPLTIMFKVIKTKSVEYMPFLISLACFANGCIWVAYAAIKLDLNILIPNSIGAVLALCQLILYGCYYKTTPRGGDKLPMTNLELSKPSAPLEI